METPEEFVGSNDQIHTPLKGRRTKRLRLNSGGADASSSSSSGGGCGGGGGEEFASSSISGEIVDHQEISTEEEEDMANCLILLAQGDGRPRQILEEAVKMERISSKRFNYEKAGFYVYECKTCNRTFPSFQALGGHRASHKKPKPQITAVAVVEEKIKKLPTTTTTTLVGREEPEEPQFNKILPTAAVQIPNKPAAANLQAKKIHECSICGLEFTSGQALGGHMRRHRAVASAQVVAMNTDHHHHHHNISSSAMETEMKQRNILELDLNLPAPEEDLRDTKFQFTPTPQTIVFSAPTLVDCHY